MASDNQSQPPTNTWSGLPDTASVEHVFNTVFLHRGQFLNSLTTVDFNSMHEETQLKLKVSAQNIPKGKENGLFITQSQPL